MDRERLAITAAAAVGKSLPLNDAKRSDVPAEGVPETIGKQSVGVPQYVCIATVINQMPKELT